MTSHTAFFRTLGLISVVIIASIACTWAGTDLSSLGTAAPSGAPSDEETILAEEETIPPTAAPILRSSAREEMFAVRSDMAVYNGATAPTTFTIGEAWQVIELVTYHWNEGLGAPPGTVGLQAADGTMYGPWQATGLEGQGGVANAYWLVNPDLVLPAGAYTVIDSDPSTWAQNAETGGAGMAWAAGVRQGTP